MTRIMFQPYDIQAKRAQLDASVWYSHQAPIWFLSKMILGLWTAPWASYKLLSLFSPFDALNGFGDYSFFAFIYFFLGPVAALVGAGIPSALVSGLARLVTGKGLYSSLPAPELLKHLDSSADTTLFVPLFVGWVAGPICWMLNFDPVFSPLRFLYVSWG